MSPFKQVDSKTGHTSEETKVEMTPYRKRLKRLFQLNLACAVIHLALFGVFLGFTLNEWVHKKGTALQGIRTSTYVVRPIFSNTPNGSTVDRGTAGAVELVEDSNVPIPVLVFLFPFITGLFHLYIAGFLYKDIRAHSGKDGQLQQAAKKTSKNDKEKNIRSEQTRDSETNGGGLFQSSYARDVLTKATNYRRWLEYAVTATIMIIIVALSFGLKEFYALLLIAGIIPVIMYLGHVTEQAMFRWSQAAQRKKHETSDQEKEMEASIEREQRLAWTATLIGWFLLLLVLGVLMYALYDVVCTLDTFRKNLPADSVVLRDFNDFKALILASGIGISVLYLCFGLVQLLDLGRCSYFSKENRISQVESRGYRNELWYCGLSLGSKTFLILLLFWGLYGRSQNMNDPPPTAPESS